MSGLQKILKMYGGMKINGVKWVWDYAKEEPRIESEMTKAEIAASERAKWKNANASNHNKYNHLPHKPTNSQPNNQGE